MGKVLLDINVLGSFTSADDVVAPFDARSIVLVYRGRLLLLEPETVQESQEVQNLPSSSRCCVVLGLLRRERCGLLHLRLLHELRLVVQHNHGGRRSVG